MTRYSGGDLDIDDDDDLRSEAPSLITSSAVLDSPATARFNDTTFSTDLDDTDYYVDFADRAGFQGPGRPPLYAQVSYDENEEHNPPGSFEPAGAQPPMQLRSSFEYSQPRVSVTGSETGGLAALAPGSGGLRGSNLVDRDITALSMSPSGKKERKSDYKGRYRIWPGVLLLLALAGASVYAITHFAIQKHDDAVVRQAEWQAKQVASKQIKSANGKTGTSGTDVVEDDGVIGNPKKYPPSTCELPDYQSKNGRIYAVSKNGTEVPIGIKGVNWFGMETGQAVPFGLWDNSMNGTTAYQIATFLADNKFNAVRLPLMVAWILENKEPNGALVNKQENRALSLKNYMSLLKSIIKVLQMRNIGVLLSMHTLEYNDNGHLWYNEKITEKKFLSAIDVLTENLCSNEYWNIMGIDLKNEPYKGTWGDGTATDFLAGSQRIANQMLKGCKNWMGFVEGVNGQRSVTIEGEKFEYYDWYGGGLQGAKTAGVEFDVANKVVYAPHYYTPAVYPQRYFFGAGTSAGGALKGFTELDDDTLRLRIQATIDDMFGFLASSTGPALVMGEFGGLYAKDTHPMKTTKRCTDFTLEIIKKPGWSGGFMWSLNPESAYQYNPADKAGHYTEGLLQDDWLQANDKFLEAMTALDDLKNLRPFPCFPAPANTTAA